MVEVMVAVSIITVSVLAAMAVTEKSILVSRQALHASEASFLLEEGAEIMRILRDNSWSNISSLSASTLYYPVFSGSWSVSSTPSSVGNFVRTVSVASVNRDASSDISSSGTDDPLTKLITINVSWEEVGQTVNKALSFYVMDIFS